MALAQGAGAEDRSRPPPLVCYRSPLGAVAALGTISSTQAAPAPTPTDALQAHSYADLLEPIPNAGALLQAMDEQKGAATDEGNIQLAQQHHHSWVGSRQPESHIAYFQAVRARSRRHVSKSASVRLARNTPHAASKAARACSKLSAVPMVHSPAWLPG